MARENGEGLGWTPVEGEENEWEEGGKADRHVTICGTQAQSPPSHLDN
jgi:hypothetical protein